MIDDWTGNQRFFLAFAQNWREKIRDKGPRAWVATDVPAPAMWRIQTARHLDGWCPTFDVRPGRAWASGPARLWSAMDFDQLLVRFFGTEEIAGLTAEQLAAGIDRLRLQIGLERDGGRRFALWCLAYMLGAAPDLDVAFEDEEERDAARDFMDTIDREIEAED